MANISWCIKSITNCVVASFNAFTIGHPVDRLIAVIIQQLPLYVQGNIPIKSIDH
jgi:hypothetical protein